MDHLKRHTITFEQLLLEMWRHQLRESIARALTHGQNGAETERPVTVAGDYYGPSVNIAARLVQLARPSTILVNAALGRRLPAELQVKPLAPQVLRGCGTQEIYAIERA